MIKAIAFDLGEVLINGLIGMEKILNAPPEIINNFNKKISQGSLIDLFTGKISEEDYWEEIINSNNWPFSVQELKQKARENFTEVDGTREIILLLKQKGYKIALLSDHFKGWITEINNKFKHHDLFDEIIYSFEVGAIKKQELPFKELIKRLNLNPKEILFVDDGKHNIEIANNLNIKTHLFENSEKLKEHLKNLNLI